MKPKKITRQIEVQIGVGDASERKGRLKDIGGSMSDAFNIDLAKQTARTLWFFENADAEEIKKQADAAVHALVGIKPGDELEGMIAAQLISCHNASMECYRRAMIPDQTFEAWRENLNQANKLSRTYAVLLDGLNRHRGKGQQKVTVEHVHVYGGGQAIVGNVDGGGVAPKQEKQPHALGYAPGTKMPRPDTPPEPLPVACNDERSMSDARRKVTRSAEGKP
jgi:hypothetical protein